MRASTLFLAGLTGLGVLQAGSAAYIPAKAVVAQVLLDRAFDRSVASHRPIKPWSWADMAPVARLSIARTGMNVVVLDSGSGQAMAFGPTVVKGTAMPASEGTSVIAAHRDTHFEGLQKVGTGDEVRVETVGGKTALYRVTGMEVRRWDRFAIPSDRSEGRLALVTCYPFGATQRGPLRYIVHAERVG